MKIKHILATLGLASLMVVGVGVGLAAHNHSSQAEIKEVKAAEGDKYYLVGAADAGATSASASCLYGKSFDNTDTSMEFSDGGAAQSLKFYEGDIFKFFHTSGSWAGELNGTVLLGSARGYFVNDTADNNNFKCVFGGTYNVKIKDAKVYIDVPSIKYADVFIQLNGWAHTYAYAYDEETHSGYKMEPLGAWPGTEVTNITAGVDFCNDYMAGGGIGKVSIPYLYDINTKIIFNVGNNSTQTKNLPLEEGAYYLANTDSITYIDGKGASAAAVFDIAEEVNRTGSSCTVTQSKASELLTTHAAVLTNVFVTKSTLWTWKEDDKTAKDNITFDKIIARLQLIADGNGTSNGFIRISNDNNNMLLIAVIASISVVSLVGTVLIIRKRKHE